MNADHPAGGAPSGAPPPVREASRTAIGVAMMRAAHRRFDGAPFVLDDSIAEAVIGPTLTARLLAEPARYQEPAALALRAHVVLRSRVAEDTLHAVHRRGVARYLLLGAGLDTFAWRQPPWAQAIDIVEVDHPASQADKRGRLARAGLTDPANLRWAPIDFSQESLAEGLARHNLSRAEPVVAALLGVSMYLTPDEVQHTLNAIGAFAPGTTLVMTYAHADEDGHPASKLAARAAEVGEPWRSAFTREELDERLAAAGFSHRHFPTVDEITPYFAGTTLPPPRRTSLAIATV